MNPLEKVSGEPCPDCGCEETSRAGNAGGGFLAGVTFRCEHCGRRFTVRRPWSEARPEKKAKAKKGVK